MPFNFGAARKTTKVAGFMAPAAQVPDPLAGVESTGNTEQDAVVELDALAKGFRARRDQEAKRVRNATDSEFWLALCFRDRASKDAFIAAMGMGRLGDKYVDGHELAKLLGVDIEPGEGGL